MDRTAVYAVAATKLAIEDAGSIDTADGDDRTGVILGTWTAGGGSTQIFLDALFRQGLGARRRSCSTARWRIPPRASSVSIIVCAGPNMTVSHKEASGLAAIVERRRSPPRRRASSLDRRRRRRDLRNVLQGARPLRRHVAGARRFRRNWRRSTPRARDSCSAKAPSACGSSERTAPEPRRAVEKSWASRRRAQRSR